MLPRPFLYNSGTIFHTKLEIGSQSCLLTKEKSTLKLIENFGTKNMIEIKAKKCGFWSKSQGTVYIICQKFFSNTIFSQSRSEGKLIKTTTFFSNVIRFKIKCCKIANNPIFFRSSQKMKLKI